MYVKFPNIRTKAKDIFQTTASKYSPDENPDRTTSTDAPTETVKSAKSCGCCDNC